MEVGWQQGMTKGAETESRRARVMQRIWKAKVEKMAQATEAQTGIQKAAVEPERQRTKVEPEGRRSLTEPEGRRDEAQPEKWSPEAVDGQQLTKRDEGARRGWWTNGPRWR